jgi:hypothetical protein
MVVSHKPPGKYLNDASANKDGAHKGGDCGWRHLLISFWFLFVRISLFVLIFLFYPHLFFASATLVAWTAFVKLGRIMAA